MAKPPKVYTLDNGDEVTAPYIADKTGVSITTARCRLARTRDPKKIFVLKVNSPRKGKFKVYTLDDGSKWTIPQITKHTGITHQCAGARLHVSREATKVLRSKKQLPGENLKEVRKTLSERMYFDPDGFWKLFNKVL